MKKVMLAVMVLSAVVNGAYASGTNNLVGGTDNVATANSAAVFGYKNIVNSNNAIAFGENNTVAIGNGASVVQDESVAIGHTARANTVKATPTMTVNGTTYNLSGIAPVGTLSVGDTGKERTITNVAAGRVIDGSTDAINGSQLKATVDEINTNGSKINNITSRVDHNDQRLDYLQGDVKANTTNIANNTKTINDHGKVLANHEQRIQTLEDTDKTLKTDVANTQNQVNINTKDITDLKGKVGNVAAIKNELNNKVNNLGQRVNKLGASSAALAGLHPMEFNKDDKFSRSVAYGHYKNANAVALGAYYRPNEKVLLGIAGTFGSENMYNVSASFKFGKHSEYEPQAKRDGEIEAMKAQIAELTARLDAVSK